MNDLSQEKIVKAFETEKVLQEFIDKWLKDGSVDLNEYCRKYPSLKEIFQRKYQAISFIQGGFQEEGWLGRKIGEYIIVQEIGRGGMGIVFLAIQPSLNRYVALKILPYGLTFDSKSIKRFQSEAKIVAKFDHPNIVPIFSMGEEEGAYYIAMGLVPGLSLNKIINTLKSISLTNIRASTVRDIILKHPDFIRLNFNPEKEVQRTIMAKRSPLFWEKSYYEFILALCIEIADALNHAHSNKIYHCDLKPSNIILTSDGIPMIVDFGLAKDMKAITTIQSKEFAGTLAYASPEQIKNNVIDEKSDLWSLGVTLYELISFNHPFYGETVSETLHKILNSEPPFLRKLSKKVPKELEAIIFKCLEKSPNKRYSSMATLEEDLKNFLELKPIKAKPIGKIGRLRKCAKRHPLISLLSFVLMFSLLASSFLSFNKKIDDLINKGGIFQDQGKYKEALYNYNKAMGLLKLMPFSTQRRKEIFHEIGNVLFSKGEYDKAIFYYTKVIEIDSKYCPAIERLGDVSLEKGLYDDAIKFYKIAIGLSPNKRENYYYVGEAFAKKGLLDEAIKNYLIVITLAPDDLDTLKEIVSVLNKKGLYEKDEVEKYLEDMNYNNEQINSVLSVLN